MLLREIKTTAISMLQITCTVIKFLWHASCRQMASLPCENHHLKKNNLQNYINKLNNLNMYEQIKVETFHLHPISHL